MCRNVSTVVLTSIRLIPRPFPSFFQCCSPSPLASLYFLSLATGRVTGSAAIVTCNGKHQLHYARLNCHNHRLLAYDSDFSNHRAVAFLLDRSGDAHAGRTRFARGYGADHRPDSASRADGRRARFLADDRGLRAHHPAADARHRVCVVGSTSGLRPT
jgi:hypothetical protein